MGCSPRAREPLTDLGALLTTPRELLTDPGALLTTPRELLTNPGAPRTHPRARLTSLGSPRAAHPEPKPIFSWRLGALALLAISPRSAPYPLAPARIAEFRYPYRP